jgi:hypothetical protein
VPISSSVDYCHPSWFFIGNPPTAQATILLARSLLVLVIATTNAFGFGAGPAQPIGGQSVLGAATPAVQGHANELEPHHLSVKSK